MAGILIAFRPRVVMRRCAGIPPQLTTYPEHGVLTISLPKAEKAKAKEIAVKVG